MPPPDPSLFAWCTEEAPRTVLAALRERGGARFVGGCVRDSLLGIPPGTAGRTDIDVATTLHPQQTLNALQAAGIRAIPTGIEHGTITAVVAGCPIEITTLRSDVTTDGRRATVAFTEDWAEDASRRDFTINALYLDEALGVVDFFGGLEDLQQGRVRFIGTATDRLREDYLRILRFMRFTARFSDVMDAEGWDACRALQAGIQSLSKERIWQEMRKLVLAPRAVTVLHESAASGILAQLTPRVPAHPARFALVAASAPPSSVPLALRALWPDADRAAFRAAFKPPRTVLDQIDQLDAARAGEDQGLCLRALHYRFGADATRDAIQLAAAENQTPTDDPQVARRLAVLSQQSEPAFPLRGADVIGAGVPAGPAVKAILAKAEALWIAEGLPDVSPDQAQRYLLRVLDQR